MCSLFLLAQSLVVAVAISLLILVLHVVCNIILVLLLCNIREDTVLTTRGIKDDTLIIVLTSYSGVHHLCYDVCSCHVVVSRKLSVSYPGSQGG